MNKKEVDITYKSASTPVGEWLEFRIIEKAEWFPVGVKAMFLIFNSSTGTIKGNVRIKDSEETYPFSTDINNESTPIEVQNLWLPDKNQYQHFPIIEYMATQESDEDAVLVVSIIGLRTS